jgi:pimeloyl-ACP methyl ester carboxylesterase
MSDRPLVILHGWSDTGESFDPLARHLSQRLPNADISLVSIGDYMSMNDDIRFDDLQQAMQRAWIDRRLPRSPGSVDVIIHSTGGLIIREWLDRNFPVDKSPIKHLVMLAPANFGSPLAHKGRSFLGRAVKGFFGRNEGQGLFNTGTHILNGLELASPFSWDLAMRDRFGRGKGRYAPGRILCTVLIGNTGYRGIRSIANEDGSDGTVRISTANLECEHVTIRYDTRKAPMEGEPDHMKSVPKIASRKPSTGRTAFRVIERIDHSSITLNAPESRLTQAQREVLDLTVKALTVADNRFKAFCDECDRATQKLTQTADKTSGTPAFQNTVVRAQDQFGAHVDDYLLEFYDIRSRDGGGLAKAVHENAIRKVHVYQHDASYRSLYIDTARLIREARRKNTRFGFSVTATPILDDRRMVGFQMLRDEDVDDLSLTTKRVQELFQPHRTLLIDIIIARLQQPQVFRLRDAR